MKPVVLGLKRGAVALEPHDAAAAERMISLLMGDKVDPRREYIISHADFNKEDQFDASHGAHAQQGNAAHS